MLDHDHLTSFQHTLPYYKDKLFDHHTENVVAIWELLQIVHVITRLFLQGRQYRQEVNPGHSWLADAGHGDKAHSSLGDNDRRSRFPQQQSFILIENKFMFLGSWVFWASGTFNHSQRTKSGIFTHFQALSEGKIRHFRAKSGTFRHFQEHDVA